MTIPNSTDVAAQKFQAIALTVSGVDRLKDFYVQALGFKLSSDSIMEGEHYSRLEGIAAVKIRIAM